MLPSISSLATRIPNVKEKELLISHALSDDFWDDLTYLEVQRLMSEVSPLMKFKRSEPRTEIVPDIDDVIQTRSIIEYGPITELKSDYVKDYQEKVERHINFYSERYHDFYFRCLKDIISIDFFGLIFTKILG
jgi:hypothetical protein